MNTATDNARRHAADMIAAADWLDSLDLPDLDFTWYRDRIHAFALTAEQMRAAARTMAPVEKDGDDNYLTLIRRFGSFTVEVFSHRDTVCERIQVGTATVERPVVVTTEAVEEPVYEWKCSPLLAEPELTNLAERTVPA